MSNQSKVFASLPPEVWICIFHHATHVPGTLVPEIYAGLVGPDHNSAFHSRLRQALVTKCTLVRVCKQWWHLAIPCLYQSVFIRRVCCLASVSKTLADFAAGKGAVAGTRLLGEYTQRLDIVIHDHSVNERAESAWLAAIINHMPNLAIVSFSSSSSYTVQAGLADDVVDALYHTAPSLRVLDWSWGLITPSASQLMNLLVKCAHLRVLSCPRLVWSRDFDHGGIPPTVTTLRVQDIVHVRNFDHLLPFDPKHVRRPGPTALQELAISIDRDLSHWADLLDVYSSQLISVRFNIPSFPPLDMEGHMELLVQTCPQLRRLTLASNCFSTFIRPNLVFPPITYLGLSASHFQLTRRDFRTLFTFLEELKLSVPSLQVVQLLHERNVRCLFHSHAKFAVRALQPFMDTASFRVEDEEGVLLTGSNYLFLRRTALGLIGFCVIRQAKGARSFMMVVSEASSRPDPIL